MVLPLDHLAESVFDGRVVAINKVTVDELHGHTRLACENMCQLYLRRIVAEAESSQLAYELLTDSSTADDGHLSLLGRGGHFAGNSVVYVCIYERVERFDGVVFALAVNCC